MTTLYVVSDTKGKAQNLNTESAIFISIPTLLPTVFPCINDITATDHGVECLLNN